MTDTNAPLDFEFDDPLHISLPTSKRRKVIDLDDLVTDYYKEKSKRLEKEAKRANDRKRSNFDDEDDDVDEASREKKEALLSQFVHQCEKQVQEIKAEHEIALWDLWVFGDQKPQPSLDFPQLGRCSFLQSVMNNELNTVLELSPEKGQSFLEKLLINGWLSELVLTCLHVEESVATWSFNLMLYSASEDLRTSACNFWCTILLHKNEGGQHLIRIEGLPHYSDLKRALEVYGYLLYSSKDFSSPQEPNHAYSDSEGPPQNIRMWIKFVSVWVQARHTLSVVSNSSEAEELLGVVITFFLDRRLQGLSLLLHECLLSVISSFTDNEWHFSCERVAKSLAFRARKNMNCLRLPECISAVDARSKQLRRELAFQCLLTFFDKKVSDGEEILRLLVSINLKEENCEFFPMYICLALSEYWLFSSPLLEEKPVIIEMWSFYLRNCSLQISSTDMRPYASKVRNKASFLLQSIASRKDDD